MSDEEQASANESLQTLRDNNEAKFKDIEQLYANWIDADTKFYDENKRNISKHSSFTEEIRKQEEERLTEFYRKRAEQANVDMQLEIELFLMLNKEKESIHKD